MACVSYSAPRTIDLPREKIIDLFTLHHYARYGDVLTLAANDPRVNIQVAPSTKRFWIDIHAKLEREKPAFVNFLRAGDAARHPCATHLALLGTCAAMRLDVQHTLDVIHAHAARSSAREPAPAPRSDVLRLLGESRPFTLAKMLYADLREVRRVVPRERAEERRVRQKTIKAMIRVWFVREPEHEANPEMWRASAELLELMDDMRAAKPEWEPVVWGRGRKLVGQMMLMTLIFG